MGLVLWIGSIEASGAKIKNYADRYWCNDFNRLICADYICKIERQNACDWLCEGEH
jgi:hypothetical protein